MTEIITQAVKLEARDGFAVSAQSICPPSPRAAVLISSGTGFPKELYARLAAYGAERGYASLIYDYRGIAGSAPQTMRGFQADIMDWARLDFPAALDAATSALRSRVAAAWRREEGAIAGRLHGEEMARRWQLAWVATSSSIATPSEACARSAAPRASSASSRAAPCGRQ